MGKNKNRKHRAAPPSAEKRQAPAGQPPVAKQGKGRVAGPDAARRPSPKQMPRANPGGVPIGQRGVPPRPTGRRPSAKGALGGQRPQGQRGQAPPPPRKEAAGERPGSRQKRPQAGVEPPNTRRVPRKKQVSTAQRRRNRRLATIAFVGVLIIAGIFISMNVLFKVEKFEVEGESVYSQQELETAFGVKTGVSMVSFNAEKSAREMEKTLPYLEHVTIRRRLPSTIIFRVIPAVETYYIALETGKFVVLSAEQKVLRIADEAPENVTFIHGIGEGTAVPGSTFVVEDTEKKDALNELIAVLNKNQIEQVAWVDVASPAALSFRWQHRFTIVLGAKTNLQEKLDYAMLLLTDTAQSGITEGDSGTLDVSMYPPEAHYRPGDGAVW